MRVFVSIDMEGLAGVLDRRQVWRGQDDFAEARRLMAEEANAVAGGCFDAGAEAVVVNDSHGDMCNLRPSDLDPRVELQIGSGKVPHGMVFAATDCDVAMFVGYHASVGTPGGILEHSYSSSTVTGIRVNGADVGECELNALLLAEQGVPVVLVSGDDKVCAQAAAALPQVRTVTVKQGLGFRAGRSLSPARACELLRTAASEVVAAALSSAPVASAPVGPYDLELDVVNTAMAEQAALMPRSERRGPRTVAYRADTVDEVYRARGIMTALASSAIGL